MREDRKITVFLVADHEVVRHGVHEPLSVEDDIDVVGEAGTAADSLVRVPATRSDGAVLDVRLPDVSGVEVCREVRSRNEDIKCLMLTSFADDELFDDELFDPVHMRIEPQFVTVHALNSTPERRCEHAL